MAYIAGAAIVTRIREVLEDGRGTLRTITASTYEGQIYGPAAGDNESLIASVKPRVEASITSVERHEASPPEMGNQAIYRLAIEVRLIRHLDDLHKVKDSVRDTAKAAAMTDADKVRQALGYPGNLTQTEAAVTTGLVSGCLVYEASSARVVLGPGETGGRIETIHRFTAAATSVPAVT